MTMTHPGLPEMWVFAILALMAIIVGWALFSRPPGQKDFATFSLSRLPLNCMARPYQKETLQQY
jgi:hypothetical protein